MGFPVDGLAFDPDLVIRGLVIDKERGNLVKADQFGYIKKSPSRNQNVIDLCCEGDLRK